MFLSKPCPKGGAFLTIVSLALAACQQHNEPSAGLAEPAPKIEVAPDPGTASAARGATELSPPVAEQKPPAAVPLNLDIPEDLLDEQTRTGYPQTADNRLPNLFAEQRKRATSLSGELLFDEDQDIALDTISGAKITINIPTGNKE